MQQIFFSENLLPIEEKRTEILINKLVSLGLSILDISEKIIKNIIQNS